MCTPRGQSGRARGARPEPRAPQASAPPLCRPPQPSCGIPTLTPLFLRCPATSLVDCHSSSIVVAVGGLTLTGTPPTARTYALRALVAQTSLAYLRFGQPFEALCVTHRVADRARPQAQRVMEHSRRRAARWPWTLGQTQLWPSATRALIGAARRITTRPRAANRTGRSPCRRPSRPPRRPPAGPPCSASRRAGRRGSARSRANHRPPPC